MNKKCGKCGKTKAVAEFDHRKSRGNRPISMCKACRRESARDYYRRNSKRMILRQMEYARTHRDIHQRASRRYYANHREMVLAASKRLAAKTRPAIAARTRRYRQKNLAKMRLRGRCLAAVHKAKVGGKLVQQPCESCATTKNIHAHHEDYSKPLDVQWLCARCHKRRHAELARQHVA